MLGSSKFWIWPNVLGPVEEAGMHSMASDLSLLFLVSSIVFVIAQDAVIFDSRVKQADLRNLQLSDSAAAFRYRVSGLVTAACIVLLYASVLLWLFDDAISGLSGRILLIGLTVLALVLYHNSKYVHRRCLFCFRWCLIMCYLSRALVSIWTLFFRAQSSSFYGHLGTIIDFIISFCLSVLLFISRDIIDEQVVRGYSSSLTTPLLPEENVPVITPFQMGNPPAQNLISRTAFLFVGKLLRNAGNFTDVKKLPPLGLEEMSQFNVQTYQQQTSTTFYWRLWNFASPVLMLSGYLELFQSCLGVMQPLIINRLLTHLEGIQRDQELNTDIFMSRSRLKAYVSVVLLTACACTTTFFITMYFHMQFRLATRLRSLLINLIYRKAMRLPLKKTAAEVDKERNAERTDIAAFGTENKSAERSVSDSSTGQIVNMITSDVARIEWATMALHSCWGALLQLVLPVYLLYVQVGWPAFTVIGVMVVGIPIANLVFKFQIRNASEIMKWKDERLAVSREVFSNIKCIKLFGWEGELSRRILRLREKELRSLWRLRIGEFLNNTLWNGLPIVMSLTVFGCCALAVADANLSVQQLLTAFAIVNMIAFPMSFLPLVAAAFSEGVTTLGRLNKFLSAPELNTSNRLHVYSCVGSPYSVVCEKLDFQWDADKSIVKGLSFKLRTGVHLAVIGPTGSGKSTLLEMIVGHLNPTFGHLAVYGSISYCAQDVWLQSGTIQSNVLFGAPMQSEKYRSVIQAAALVDDLKELPLGDKTQIGTRGCALSGGQRHRVALARALYRDADCYIFDDVLSAVDHKVARQICAEALGKMLKSKTIILVTHRAEGLEFMDYILAIERGGQWVLRSASEGATLLEEAKSPMTGKKRVESPGVISVPRLVPASPAAHLPSVEPPREESWETPRFNEEFDADSSAEGRLEKVSVHQIPWQTYLLYFQACGGVALVCLMCALSVGSQSFSVFSSWFLSAWASLWSGLSPPLRLKALFLFAFSNASALLFLALTSLLGAYLAQRASRLLHGRLVKNLLAAPLLYIEGTPEGSVLNRLSQDVQILDERLPQSLLSVMQESLKVFSILFITVAVLPVSILLIAPLTFIYRNQQKRFVALARQMQRLDANLRSPLVAHFSESTEGIATIRAFDVIGAFVQEQQRRLDRHLRASFLSLLMNRWLATRLELMGTLLTCVVGLLCIWRIDTISVATAGLAMSYCMLLSGAMAWLVRVHGDKENNIVSVERLAQYSNCPLEEPESEITQLTRMPSEWPSFGAVDFSRVTVRYSPTSEPALENISLQFKPSQKVAVLGRTGAGKSTLLSCLFRLVPYSGEIIIDGMDIATVSLQCLRSSLAIIPQDPVILAGTIRVNVDPFNRWQDEEILEALELVTLRPLVDMLPDGIYTSLSDGSFTFSVGQRQLLCLARVLLRDVRVLVLDEATSAMDPGTDALMQKLIRRHFQQCTVITIAHRIGTVLDYDMALVLENGKLAEVGSPASLLATPGSLLAALHKASLAHDTFAGKSPLATLG
eukprot:Gregarina_sp_Poly_1__10645@NODE_7_length_24424_cov_76_286365_g6_i0_p3_GENE_NODE_7_length_24424_cov_76_286365_g6_i0NODE_7_length_24424_cov_76_286365_g6_i0_p3_ORF_typecomplete_len1518_score224_00ABC_membrane/PF00664_23/1_8e34ABC_membrane/PF00664_23/6_9e36ABC_tran/PF00005_27/2e26ABC_tran/PF00005_27/6_5e31SMC_N/PF02463_19/0_25SMC_N/PF02463_19/1_3e06SMC_N/PF02463_19/27SMC_N/PF02463_19/0_74T2SSE/PF00437_20/0_00011T2SSE/PF00437_20/0_009AAA_22/PF13401_6/0_006AAA_22/PF13401_6/0_014AAA_29/PF13555_6/0_0012